MPCPVPRGFAACPYSRSPCRTAFRPCWRISPCPCATANLRSGFLRACGRLRFHCGCPIVEEADKAAFALVADASELPPLSAFAQGVPAYPDRSATVLLAGLAFDAGTRFRGSGPGICGESTFTCTLPEDFAERWRENTSGFPLGVDMLLCGADGVAGLPRTTRLERLPQESASCM